MKNKTNWRRYFPTIRVTLHGDLLIGYKVASRTGKESKSDRHFEIVVVGDNAFPEEKDYPSTWFEEDYSSTGYEPIPEEYSRNILYYNPKINS